MCAIHYTENDFKQFRRKSYSFWDSQQNGMNNVKNDFKTDLLNWWDLGFTFMGTKPTSSWVKGILLGWHQRTTHSEERISILWGHGNY